MANDIRLGRTLGPYEIEEMLGGGGMATVYRGVHRALGVERAIKVMSSGLATRDSFVELFYREARLAAGLRHPNIVQIFDIAQQDDLHYLVMEMLEGRSLHDLIRRETPLPLSRGVHLVGQLASALDYAHHQGIAHRDVKPANAFVSPADLVTLVDFGIARAADATHLTVTHGVGTPEYMAPELFDEQLAPAGARGHEIGVGADLYSLGIVAYALVTGSVPFTGRTPNAVAYSQVNHEPPSPRTRRPDLPVAAEAVILRQLAKDSSQRYRPARAFAEALAEAVYAGEPAGVPSSFYHAATILPSWTGYDNRALAPAGGRYPVSSAAESGSRKVPGGAGSRWRWLGSIAAAALVAGAVGFAANPSAPRFSPFVEAGGLAESRRASGTISMAPATAPTSVPLPTVTSPPTAVAAAPPTVVPTAAPTVALPRIAQAAPPPAAPVILDQQVDEAIAQAIALLEEQKDPNADVAIEKLDRLHRDLDPASTRRPVVEQVMIRALIDDSQRRVRAAFTLKAQDQGRESQRILVDARLRFDRAAQLRPHDATLQERVNQGREQIELISLWVDFDAAYYAKQNDAQIAALTRIMAKNPEYRTAEGPAREKLFAAWISKAQEAWTAKQVDLARVALEEANVVEPDHPLVRQLRASWFPPRSAPVRTAAPARGGGTWSAPAVAAPEAAAAPPSQPGPPPQPSQQLVPQGAYNLEIQTSNESNQSHNSN